MKKLFFVLSVLVLISCNQSEGLTKRESDCKVITLNPYSFEYHKDNIQKVSSVNGSFSYEYKGKEITETYNYGTQSRVNTYIVKNCKIVSATLENGTNPEHYEFEYDKNEHLVSLKSERDTAIFTYSGNDIVQCQRNHIGSTGIYPISTYNEFYDICNLSTFIIVSDYFFTPLAFTHFGKGSEHPIKQGDYTGNFEYTSDDNQRINSCEGSDIDVFVVQCKH